MSVASDVVSDLATSFVTKKVGVFISRSIFRKSFNSAVGVIADKANYIAQQLDLRDAGERYWKKGTQKAIRAIQKAAMRIDEIDQIGEYIGDGIQIALSFKN